MSAAPYIPTDRPRLAVAGDGTVAAIGERTRIAVVSLATRAQVAEIGVDPEADAYELGWLGTPPRLLVLSRYAQTSTVHLVDPLGAHGPRALAELRLQAAMRLVATVGAHALVIGSQGAAVLTAGETTLLPYQFPARAIPTVAGAAGAQFVVALPGVIEEWDPQSRMPKRRLRLPRPAALAMVGGSERVVWMVTQHDPARIDVLPLINRGQPKVHDLPEPIAAVSSHPRADVLVCLGAESGRVYVVDLDGRTRLRVLAPAGLERVEAAALVLGRVTGVVAAQRGAPIAVLPLDGRDPDASGATPPSVAPATPLPDALADPAPGVGAPASVDVRDADAASPLALASSPAPSAPIVRRLVDLAVDPAEVEAPARATLQLADPPVQAIVEMPPLRSSPVAQVVPVAPAAAPVPSSASPGAPHKNLAERFAAVRERRQQVLADASRPIAIAAPPSTPQAAVALAPAPHPAWRDDCVAWARAILAGGGAPAPALPAIDAAAHRFGVPHDLVAAIALLYGAHLGGEPGVPPVDVARVLGGRWDEALARGELAACGAVLLERSRLSLVPELRHALDDLA